MNKNKARITGKFVIQGLQKLCTFYFKIINVFGPPASGENGPMKLRLLVSHHVCLCQYASRSVISFSQKRSRIFQKRS